MKRWIQRNVHLPAYSRGVHPIQNTILKELPEIREYQQGFLHLFLQHTSAALTINENADPDVAKDLDMAFSKISPEDWPYRHTDEGPDDMPAHVKCSLLRPELQIPIADGRLQLGTWQGIFLCEFRSAVHERRIFASIWGQ